MRSERRDNTGTYYLQLSLRCYITIRWWWPSELRLGDERKTLPSIVSNKYQANKLPHFRLGVVDRSSNYLPASVLKVVFYNFLNLTLWCPVGTLLVQISMTIKMAPARLCDAALKACCLIRPSLPKGQGLSGTLKAPFKSAQNSLPVRKSDLA